VFGVGLECGDRPQVAAARPGGFRQLGEQLGGGQRRLTRAVRMTRRVVFGSGTYVWRDGRLRDVG
jgi:hypothetical protein